MANVHAQPVADGNQPAPFPVTSLQQTLKFIGGGTNITIHAEAETPQAVLKDVFGQAGITVDQRIWNITHRDGSITADIRNLPFWDAIRALSLKGDVGADESGSSSNELSLRPATYTAPFRGLAVSAAPFLFILKSTTRETKSSVLLDDSGDVNPSKRPYDNKDALNLKLHVYIDPKLEIVPGTSRYSIIEATDENGKAMTFDTSPHTVLTNAHYVIPLNVGFDPGKVQGSKIAKLKGTFSTLYVTKSQKWEIANALNAKNVAFAGNADAGTPAATFVEMHAWPSGYQADATFDTRLYANSGTLNYLTDFYVRRAQLISGDRTITAVAGNSRGPAMSKINDPILQFDSHLVFGSRGSTPLVLDGPITFRWDMPTEFARVEVPFEFTNIPLPGAKPGP